MTSSPTDAAPIARARKERRIRAGKRPCGARWVPDLLARLDGRTVLGQRLRARYRVLLELIGGPDVTPTPDQRRILTDLLRLEASALMADDQIARGTAGARTARVLLELAALVARREAELRKSAAAGRLARLVGRPAA